MAFIDSMMRASDTIENVVSVASSKKEFILKQVINVFLLFIILLVFGCLDFATLEFHYEYILTASYWGTVGSKVIAGVCAYNIGINMLMDAEIKKDSILAEQITRYGELIKYKQVDFEYFVMKVFNRKSKIQTYISNINKKIHRLNRFSRARDRLLYSSDLPENQDLKLKNRYCIRRAELERLKSEEFIEKNIDSIYVKYLEVDPAVFELEIDGAVSVKGVRTKGSLNVGRIKASSNVVLGMVLISMFFTAFGLSADQQQFENQMVAFWHYCLKAAQDVGVVLWQFTRGMFVVRKIISQQLTAPYAGRNQVLQEYINWRLENKIPDTPVYTELHQDDDIIEISEEDYEKLKGEE